MKKKTHIVIHIPKSAGTSLNVVIQNNYKESEVFNVNREVMNLFGQEWKDVDIEEREEKVKNKFKNLAKNKRESYRVILGHMSYGWHEYFDDAEYYAILRDPIERVISLYNYINKIEGHWIKLQMEKEEMGFSEFIRSDLSNEISNGMSKRLTDTLYQNPEDEILKKTVFENIDRFKFIGFQEDYVNSLHLLKKFMGFSSVFYIHYNQAENNNINMISIGDRNFLETKNQVDYDLYQRAYSKFLEQKKDYNSYLNISQRLLFLENFKYKVINKTKSFLK